LFPQNVDWQTRGCSHTESTPRENICQELHGAQQEAVTVTFSWSVTLWNRLVPVLALRPHALCAVQQRSENGTTWTCQTHVVPANKLHPELGAIAQMLRSTLHFPFCLLAGEVGQPQ
jgi:hypothetical protein